MNVEAVRCYLPSDVQAFQYWLEMSVGPELSAITYDSDQLPPALLEELKASGIEYPVAVVCIIGLPAVRVEESTLYLYFPVMVRGVPDSQGFYAETPMNRMNPLLVRLIPLSTQPPKCEVEIDLRSETFRPTFDHLLQRISEAWPGSMPSSLESPDLPVAKQESDEVRAPLPGVLERRREFHRLRRLGYTIRECQRRAKSDSRTYYYWCLKATGEEPLYEE